MILQPEDTPSIGSYTLEDPVAIQKPVIEDRNRGLLSRNKLPVKINKTHMAS
jgi:hypothetical protein